MNPKLFESGLMGHGTDLTLRDVLAMQALATLSPFSEQTQFYYIERARMAWRLADALLATRDEKQQIDEHGQLFISPPTP